MKIIRPIDLTADGVVESNAPADGYSTWVPDGRDFMGSYSLSPSSVSGDIFYTARDQRDVFRVDLSTGATQKIYAANVDLLSISPSPLDDHIAYAEGSVRFVLTYPGMQQVVDFSDASSQFAWSPDGSKFACFYDASGVKRLRVYDTATWQFSEGRTFSQIGDGVRSDDIINLRQQYIGGICFDANSLSVYFTFRESGYTQTGTAAYSVLVKADASTLSDAAVEIPGTDYSGWPSVSHNPQRNEVFISGRPSTSMRVYDDSALTEKAQKPTSVACESVTVSADGSQILVKTQSISPIFRRYNASTHVDELQLDSILGDPADDIYFSTNYYVATLQAGGYALIDRTDDTLITQTNPTVTAGDIYTYGDHNYEALTDNNDRPDLGAIADPPTWLDLGFINPLRMFDKKLDSRTTAPSPLTIDITPGMLVNGLALFNVDASTVQITYTDPDDGLVYDTGQISMLDNSGVQDWYGFFFDPYLAKADLARVDLPAYIDGTVQITLDGAGADVAIGEVVLGTIYQIGDAQYGSSAGIIDFSRKETDQFGNFEIVPRRFSKRAEFDAVLPPAYGGSVQRTLARLRATPIVWIGSVDLEETIVYGYFREFDILLSNPAFSNVTITVEGL